MNYKLGANWIYFYKISFFIFFSEYKFLIDVHQASEIQEPINKGFELRGSFIPLSWSHWEFTEKYDIFLS